MKRDDLSAYSGFHVSVIIEETPSMARLQADDPQRAHLTVPESSVWTAAQPYYLSDEDIAGLTPHGPNHLISQIVLSESPRSP